MEKADDETASPKVLATGQLEQFIQAIFNPSEQTFQRLECPEPRNLARYSTLINPPANTPTKPRRVKFFFALDLTQCVDLLPRLLGSIVETVRFLGPENCVLSIVEGNSDDGTPEVLEALRADMEALGTEYFYQTSNIASRESAGAPGQRGDRIVRLARLRNLALQPMLDDRRRHDADTTVVFLNDVAACMEDILELVYQKALLGADMTCAMDWTYVGPTPTFYDVWISRTIAGESFFRIPEPHNWDYVSPPPPPPQKRLRRALLTYTSGMESLLERRRDAKQVPSSSPIPSLQLLEWGRGLHSRAYSKRRGLF